MTKHSLAVLTKKYRTILLKCALANAAMFVTFFAATPAMAISDPPHDNLDYAAELQNETIENLNFNGLDRKAGAFAGRTLTINGIFQDNTLGRMLQINGVYPTNVDDAEDNAAANAYIDANLTGTVIVNDDVPNGGFTLYNGKLQLGNTAANKRIMMLDIEGPSTLSLQNGAINTLEVTQDFYGNNAGNGGRSVLNLELDFDALNSNANANMDKLYLRTTVMVASHLGDAVIKVTSVNVIRDGTAASGVYMAGEDIDVFDNEASIARGAIAVTDATSSDGTLTATSGGYTYTFRKSANGVVSVTRTGSGQGGNPLPVEQTLAAAIADQTVNTFSATGNVPVDSNLGTLAGDARSLTINGNNHLGYVINGNGHAGVTVNAGQTLTIERATLSGFTMAVTNAGTTTISRSTVNSPLSNSRTMNISDSVLNAAVANTRDIIINGNVTLNAAMNGTVDINPTTGTLILGENADLSGADLALGKVKFALPATAVEAPIVNANSAAEISLDVDMSHVARDNAVRYDLTATTTGYTLLNPNNNRYAFSDGAFSLEQYKADPEHYAFNEAWHGGTLYILRLASSGEAAVEDLRNKGVHVSANEEKAMAGLDDGVMERLSVNHKAAAQKINDMLERMAADTTQVKQILREVAPEAAPAASVTASSNADAVLNVVGGRMGGGSPVAAAGGEISSKGHSGGDYTAGALSAWAQGLYNKADLHKTDGFDSSSAGFAAGFEYAVNDSVKAGFGYAYTGTDIDTERSTTDVDTHTGFVYGEYKPENLYVNGVLSYGHSTYDETTRLAGLNSEYRANTFAAQAMTGYSFGNITPEAGLRYTSVRQRSYTNALGAEMASRTTDTWTGVAGVNAAASFREDGLTAIPNAKLALTYDFKRDGQARTVTLANGSSYIANGESMKRFGVEAGIGITALIGRTEIGLSYEGKFKEHYCDHTGLINIRYNF